VTINFAESVTHLHSRDQHHIQCLLAYVLLHQS